MSIRVISFSSIFVLTTNTFQLYFSSMKVAVKSQCINLLLS